jgi:starch synthase
LHNRTAEIMQVDKPRPTTFFIRRDEYFDRSYLYSLPYRDYDDNFERFLFFQKAVVGLVDMLGLQLDLVHCNDWQTGLIPAFLKHGVNGQGRDGNERTLFTIHNLAYQGLFPSSNFSTTNLPLSCFSVDGFEYYGQINCMKAGIVFSDFVTTVSPTYAEEIRTEAFGCGLHGVLGDKGDRLTGILNGVDYALWDPATDQLIKSNYSPANLEGKASCKKDLRSVMKLARTPDTPVLGMVTRLTEQKGLDILAGAMEEIMRLDVCVAMLGTGEKKYQRLCQSWAQKWPGRFSIKLAYDNTLAHKIEAGADIYLMPSRFEPCGLNQLYSLKYGTLPVVHQTGGLSDTISEITADGTEGQGFVFQGYNADELVGAVKRAVSMYRKANAWKKSVSRVMQIDYSWKHAAREYSRLYEHITMN